MRKYGAPMAQADMAEFWDERARENAAYYVDSMLDYADPDMERFWAGGEVVVDRFAAELETPELRPDDVVVEIGCGVGRLTRPLAARAGRVVALDVSGEMLARARELNGHLDNVEWLLGDGVSLGGVADASADVVFSHVVFQHIPDPAITLGYVHEMGRVLRPGGWAAFQISNDPGVHRRRSAATRLRQAAGRLVGRAPSGQAHPAWLGSAVALDDLRAAAREGGLEVARTVGGGTQFCLVLLRKVAG